MMITSIEFCNYIPVSVTCTKFQDYCCVKKMKLKVVYPWQVFIQQGSFNLYEHDHKHGALSNFYLDINAFPALALKH